MVAEFIIHSVKKVWILFLVYDVLIIKKEGIIWIYKT